MADRSTWSAPARVGAAVSAGQYGHTAAVTLPTDPVRSQASALPEQGQTGYRVVTPAHPVRGGYRLRGEQVYATPPTGCRRVPERCPGRDTGAWMVPVGDPHLFLTKFKAGTCDALVHSLRHTFGTQIVNAASRCEWCRRSSAVPAKIASLYLQLARRHELLTARVRTVATLFTKRI